MGIFLNMMPVQKKVKILSDCHTFWTKMLLNKGLKKVRHFPVMWDSPKSQHHISVTIGPIWLKFWPILYLFLLRQGLFLSTFPDTSDGQESAFWDDHYSAHFGTIFSPFHEKYLSLAKSDLR